MCAEDNDCYYGSVERAKWGDALCVNELRGFLKKTRLTFGFLVQKVQVVMMRRITGTSNTLPCSALRAVRPN